jgi:prepilin peptidase CpaA
MQAVREFLANVVVVVTATILFYAAVTDLKEFKIRNNLVVALACLYGLYAVLLPEPLATVLWHVGVAIVMFFVAVGFWLLNWLRAGDVKLLAVSFLWVGFSYALPFTILMLIFAAGYTLLAHNFEWVPKLSSKEGSKEKRWIPYAPLVAASLIGVFVLKFFVLKSGGI